MKIIYIDKASALVEISLHESLILSDVIHHGKQSWIHHPFITPTEVNATLKQLKKLTSELISASLRENKTVGSQPGEKE